MLNVERNDSGEITTDANLAPSASRPTYGGLALWVASATALAVGVSGTIAYGIWFDRDQRAYAEAIVSAREALQSGPPVATASPVVAPVIVQRPVQQSPRVTTNGKARADTTPRTKTNHTPFARLGSFFHRVSYRRHGASDGPHIFARP
ncbi:hypothetical protein LJR230_004657 [Trinickia sp. LjRoot230]|uniref:hypothetical protein n=1 Tax=Trinickia sp. LjRoot230 TaxID=3342288 RepID=UPI003ECCDA26